MSEMAGLYRPSGPTPHRAEGLALLGELSHTAPAEVWENGPCLLGYQPSPGDPSLRSAWESGPLVVVGDIRLDNREELIVALGLPRTSSRIVPDGEIVLRAYERWGEGVVDHLLGDFAFAVWDGNRSTLFCVRDPFGVRPFYYVERSGVFAFASEAGALVRSGYASDAADEVYLSLFLAGGVDGGGLTNFEDVRRLLPAHTLTVNGQGMRVRKYWALEPDLEVRHGSDAAYAEEFFEHFAEAIRCRLRGADPPAALLSGGLDSSAIVAVASSIARSEHRGELHTFSRVYPEVPSHDGRRFVDERSFMEAVIARGHVVPHYYDYRDGLSPLVALQEYSRATGLVAAAPNLPSGFDHHRAAKQAGVRVLLDGHGGDEVVSHGGGRLYELALARRWVALCRELWGGDVAGRANASPAELLLLSAGHHADGAARRVARSLHRRMYGGGAPPQDTWESVVDPDLAERVGLAERLREGRGEGGRSRRGRAISAC